MAYKQARYLAGTYCDQYLAPAGKGRIADERGEEVIDIRHRMEKARRDGIKEIADKYGISENTVRTYHEAKKNNRLGLVRRREKLHANVRRNNYFRAPG